MDICPTTSTIPLQVWVICGWTYACWVTRVEPAKQTTRGSMTVVDVFHGWRCIIWSATTLAAVQMTLCGRQRELIILIEFVNQWNVAYVELHMEESMELLNIRTQKCTKHINKANCTVIRLNIEQKHKNRCKILISSFPNHLNFNGYRSKVAFEPRKKLSPEARTVP